MEILHFEKGNWDQLTRLLRKHWHSVEILASGELIDGAKLSGIAITIDNETAGFLTYREVENRIQIVTINSFQKRKGIGTQLLDELISLAKKEDISSLFLFTTNDNIEAHKFYERCGFLLADIMKGAVKEARKLKPQIPLVAENGIPIEDEWKYELRLSDKISIQ